MPNITPGIMRFNEKLVELAEVSARVGLAAAKATANPGGADDETREAVGKRVDGAIKDLRDLRVELEKIGQKID